MLHKYSAEVRFAVWIGYLHIVRQFLPHAAIAHVGRIRNYNIILLCHNLCHLNQWQDAVQHDLAEHTDVRPHFLDSGIEGSKVHLRDIQDRTIFLRVTQFVYQSSKVLFVLWIIVGEVVNGAAVQSVAFYDGVNVRLNAAREDTAVILPRLHHDGEIGKLRRTVINIETVKIVFKNALCRVALAIPACLINLHQHIKGIDEDVTAAHAGVDDLDVFDIQRGVLVLNLVKLLAHVLRLFRFGQIILPAHFVGNQLFRCNALGLCFIPSHFIQAATVRIDALVLALVHIDSAKAVFNHIADNPVWSEELCCGRDALFGDFHILLEQRKGIILEFGVVILIQPADDLHLIRPVRFGNIRDHVTENAVLLQNVVRQQKLGIAAHFLKHTGKRGVQGVALRQKQIAIETFGVIALDILRNFLPVQSRKVKVQDITQNLRFERAGTVGKDANMGGQIVVDLHKAQRNKAVEPSVGNLFHNLCIAF